MFTLKLQMFGISSGVNCMIIFSRDYSSFPCSIIGIGTRKNNSVTFIYYYILYGSVSFFAIGEILFSLNSVVGGEGLEYLS